MKLGVRNDEVRSRKLGVLKLEVTKKSETFKKLEVGN